MNKTNIDIIKNITMTFNKYNYILIKLINAINN